MKNFGQVAAPLDAATKEYVDDLAPIWEADVTYAAGDWCQHNGELWHNTSGAPSTGVEPGTDYNVWNVTYSNENLLDNPWFTVNQRGQTSYTGEGYTVDRWVSRFTSVNTYVNESGISVENLRDGAITISQHLKSSVPIGQIVTLSCLAKADVARGMIRLSDSDRVSYVAEFCYIPVSDDMIFCAKTFAASHLYPFCEMRPANLGIIDIRAIKLELGSVSTLANDTIPDYGTEFVKCVMSTADPNDTYANKQLRASPTEVSA